MKKYSWNAEDYEKHSGAQQQWAGELLTKLGLSGAERVLDLGCGDGKITAEIANRVPGGEVVGIDSSSSMIELAQIRHGSSEPARLRFELMDARNLKFQQYFDVVFSNAALHWVRDHRPVLSGIYASLRPGGRILLQMGGQGNAADILGLLEEIENEPEYEPYFRGFEFPYGFLGSDQYRKMLIAAGFKGIRAELIPKDMVHDSLAELQGWIRTTWLPYTERIPEQLRDGFIRELANRYRDKVPPDTDGRIHVAMVRLEVEAIRPR